MTVQFKAFIRTIMTCQSENLELYCFEQQLTILCGICAHTWQSSCMSSYNHKGCHWIILHVNPVVKRHKDWKPWNFATEILFEGSKHIYVYIYFW